jgi:hypothetical protein
MKRTPLRPSAFEIQRSAPMTLGRGISRKASLLAALDARFSAIVRGLAGWSCARCRESFSPGSPELHNSHFWHRRHMSVRFDLDNCAALCWKCHDHLDRHPDEYNRFKLAMLGHARYWALEARKCNFLHLDAAAVALELAAMERRLGSPAECPPFEQMALW